MVAPTAPVAIDAQAASTTRPISPAIDVDGLIRLAGPRTVPGAGSGASCAVGLRGEEGSEDFASKARRRLVFLFRSFRELLAHLLVDTDLQYRGDAVTE